MRVKLAMGVGRSGTTARRDVKRERADTVVRVVQHEGSNLAREWGWWG